MSFDNIVRTSAIDPEEPLNLYFRMATYLRKADNRFQAAGEIQLCSRRTLIEAFIEENLPKLKPNENVIQAFEGY